MNLTFIDPAKVGVAFLARTIDLKGDDLIVHPRLQPLSLPGGAMVIAVARIQVDKELKPSLSTTLRDRLAQAISDMAGWPDISQIQIDFDARTSEREFYRELIKEVRKQLPAHVRLSITALASWCAADDWIADLPVDEAVPMLFRMAGDGRQIVNLLQAGEDFKALKCRKSYGVSTDEPVSGLSTARRLYVFNPDAWTEASVNAILESRK